MNSKKRFLTSIQVDVFHAETDITQPKKWLERVKVYYDLVPLTKHELASIVKYIRILSRDHEH